jgi:hypothetical protein
VKEDYLRIVGGEPTPVQVLAWRRLWDILLAPVESRSTNAVDESAAMPETARPSLEPEPQHIEGTNDGGS